MFAVISETCAKELAVKYVQFGNENYHTGQKCDEGNNKHQIGNTSQKSGCIDPPAQWK